MAKKVAPLLPSSTELLRKFGERLRLARLRRGLTAGQVSERSGMSRMTLRSLERGGSGVTMGAYMAVMQVLGIETDLDFLGSVDTLGRELQDAGMQVQTNRTKGVHPAVVMNLTLPAEALHRENANRKLKEQKHQSEALETRKHKENPSRETRQLLDQAKDARRWIDTSGFADSKKLADLIDSPKSRSKSRR